MVESRAVEELKFRISMMAVTMIGKKKPPPVSSISNTSTQLDPLLRDLSEKKKSFRNSVISLSSELRDARNKLAHREDCLRKMTLAKQEVETKAEMMGQQICLLKIRLEERDEFLQKLEAAYNQRLGFNILHTREDEEHLKYVDGIQKEVVHASSNQHVSSGEDADYINIIPRLRSEIGLLSQELHSQVEKHQTRDEELKKRILKLEMCVQDGRRRMNSRKLTRMLGHKRDRKLKKLKDDMEIMRRRQENNNNIIGNVLESCCLGMIASITMLSILVFASN